MMLFAASCAPDNVISAPNDNPEPDTQTQPDTDTPSQSDLKPDVVPEPDTNTEPETDTNTEPEPQTPANPLVFEGKPANDKVVPSYTLAFDTSVLKDKTVTLFTTADSTFSAGTATEKKWFDSLRGEYGVTVKYSLRGDSTLYSSQLIAQKSGLTLDLITTRINDVVSSLSLMRSAEQFVAQTQAPLHSPSVFEKTGKKVFTAQGNARMLWYNTAIIDDDSPYTLALTDSWTTDVLSATALGVRNKSNRLIECNNWTAFGSAGASNTVGFFNGAVAFSLTSDKSIATYSQFNTILQGDPLNTSTEHSFSKGNTAFIYTDFVSKQNFNVSFAPIPKQSTDGKLVADYCGVGLGISATASDESAQTAAVVAQLWSARYTESRVDSLLTVLDAQKCENYLKLSESIGQLCSVDSTLTKLFDGNVIPASLYSTPDVVYNTFAAGYARAEALNKRLS